MTEIRRIQKADATMLQAFIDELPEGDRTFFKERIDETTVERWCADEHARRWVLCDQGTAKALLAIVPGNGWSAHVGELRLVVGSAHRRQGIGQRLARHGLTESVGMGLDKIVVEVVADRQGDIEMFTRIGFHPEALLEDQIRDWSGQVRDLVVLAHHVQEVDGSLRALGMEEAMGMEGSR
jgi:ribosomal protein S18 acetylase RimI-like enzyme